MKKMMKLFLMVSLGIMLMSCAARNNYINAHANLVNSRAGINYAKAGAIDRDPSLAVEVTDVDHTKVSVRNYKRTYVTKNGKRKVRTSGAGEDFFNK